MLDEDNCNEDSLWEDGFASTLSSKKDSPGDLVNGVCIEFDVPQDSSKREPIRRATAEEKELAELVHKAHLLCLLGRGRLMDRACDDQLIQASLLSLVPNHLLKIAQRPKLTASCLSMLVGWFRSNFQVSSSSLSDKSCHLSLASALETREGTPEAVAALSVAFFRALNLTTRFVSILDVASLKPDRDKSEFTIDSVKKRKGDVFSSSTLMTAEPASSSTHSEKSLIDLQQSSSKASVRNASKSRLKGQNSDETVTITQDKISGSLISEAPMDIPESCSVKSKGLKRKGDLQFEMELELAVAATQFCSSRLDPVPEEEIRSTPSVLKKMKKIECSNELSTAIGSKKVGAPIYWAEVFCNGENLTGKWVHVDAVNAIIDKEDKVEAAAAACKKSLRYVVAFAGHGAKDVTRRYCIKWHKIAAQRVHSTWWDSVLAPLKELESGSSGGFAVVGHEANDHKKVLDSSLRNSTRSALEDMELETRALTEPLPTNQQAYRSHRLYVIERWLKKYEALYPKGPVLGYCAGHAVYPRTCVQTLHTKEMWLREGLQVKADEIPVKTVKRHQEHRKLKDLDDNCSEENHEGITSLYGKWQTEPLRLPHAVDGIVPKNERGQIDVWSEKCLPPGTVHLPYPRLAHVAKTLEVDYAPAMIGFEFRNGRSVPIFDGIVVCTEFKDAILQAYTEEEERRQAKEKRVLEAQALSRWYQLLSSLTTRLRLNSRYHDNDTLPSPDNYGKKTTYINASESASLSENHAHEFIVVKQDSVKKCHCGFSVQYEEM